MTIQAVRTKDPIETPGTDESEAYATLQSLAHRKTLAIPTDLIVRHVLSLTPDADWHVHRAAMDAVIRRCASVRQEDLRLASGPSGRMVYGAYTIRRARQDKRPYRLLLESIDPLRGSCDCPDYLRNSLGLCKHLLVVVAGIAAKRERFNYAFSVRATTERPRQARLSWDPVRPLDGEGDWLDRIRLVESMDAGAWSESVRKIVRNRFERPRADECRLKTGWLESPEKRLGLVGDLLVLLKERVSAGVRRVWPPDPAVEALLRTEKARLEQVVADRADLPRLMEALRTLRGRLYPYQVEGVERMLASGRLLLGDDMGLGKTVQAIACCHALWSAGKVRRGFLVVPASLKPQWLREWQQFTDTPVRILEGSQFERRRILQQAKSGYLLVNYEQVIRDLEWMRDWKPDMVVLDEAQRIKNWATKTAACVKILRPHYRLILTGTPMENRLEELVSVLEWVDDQALEPKWRLTPAHSIFVDGSKGVAGARRLDTLRLRLAPALLRRRRQEVIRQLPPRTDTVIPVELTEEQRESHDALNQPVAQLMSIARTRPLSQAQFLRLMSLLTTQRMISNGLAQVDFNRVWPELSRSSRPRSEMLPSLASPKLSELREIIRSVALDQGRKVVVFSQWRRMLALAHWAVGDILDQGGVRAVFFTGQEKTRQRTANIVAFHDDPETRVFFATDAGGIGLNLQKAANCCINIELPWNPAVLEQRIGRIFRLGQKRPIDVYNLVGQECIESRIAGLVSDKRALFSGLFDGTSEEVRFERTGTFLASIQRLVDLPPAGEARDAEEEAAESGAATQGELDAVLTAADESQDAPLEPAPASAEFSAGMQTVPPLLDPAELRRLFSGLQVTREESGGLKIEASPEAAVSLAAVFEGLAQMLRQADRADGEAS